MLLLATALLVSSATAGLPMPAQDLVPNQNVISRPTARDLLDAVALQLETARIELTQVGSAQAALDRCVAACATLIQTGDSLNAEERDARSRLAQSLVDLRASALDAGAVADPTQEDLWTRIVALWPAKAAQVDTGLPSGMNEAIERYAKAGNHKFIHRLGKRAVPGLLNVLREDSNTHYHNALTDPLCMLMKIDPAAADVYVGEHSAADLPDVFWDIRFSQAIAAARPFDRSPAGTQPSMMLPHLLEQCNRLLSEPQRFSFLGRAMRPIAEEGLCTDAMLAAMNRYVDEGHNLPIDISAWWRTLSDVPKVRAVMLRALASVDSKIADAAKTALMRAATNEGVYDVILTASRKQRSRGLDWLKPRSIVSAGQADPEWAPEYGQAEADFVNALLQDPDTSVRLSALEELGWLKINQRDEMIGGWSEYGIPQVTLRRFTLPIDLPDATLLSLAADEDVKVRSELVKAARYILKQSQLALLIDALANDPVAEISDQALDLLAYLDWDKVPEQCIELVGSKSLNFVKPDPEGGTNVPMDALLHSQEGLEATVRWAVERNDSRLLTFVAYYFRPQVRALPPELWARLVASIMQRQNSHSISFNGGTRLDFAHRRSDPEARSAAVQWAVEGNELTATTIYGLLSGAPAPETDQLVSAIIRMLKKKAWPPNRGSQSQPSATGIHTVLSEYSSALRERVAQRLIAAPDIAPEQISQSFGQVAALPVTPEVIAYAKANTERLRHPGSLVHTVLKAMSNRPELADIPWIQSVTRDPRFASSGIDAMAKLRNPEFQPSLAEIIEGPSNAHYYTKAVLALSSNLSDETAGLLLLAARKTGDEELRAICLAKVEEIAALQDAEQRLSTRGIARATREVTVSKLMELLTDNDNTVRIEAIKGLGTWEAVEAMPELIGLLKDKDKSVSAAARATLDLLNER